MDGPDPSQDPGLLLSGAGVLVRPAWAHPPSFTPRASAAAAMNRLVCEKAASSVSSPAGLEIFAQPPGKKLATLSLLSGGEQALTALSLIFAVFRCNPAPVCVLDEVDAPLDDANVERFCLLLMDMVRETGTRFLVVTHHPLTMARMDRLYGVTMQERGVSRLLSVDLAQAELMLDQPQVVAA